MIVLGFIASVWALDCAELERLRAQGVGDHELAGMVQRCDVTADDLRCLVDAHAGPELLESVRRSIVDCSSGTAVPSPVVEAERQVADARADLVARSSLPPQFWDAPDPGVAVGLSVVPGFGAGHFYAHRPIGGATYLLVELVGVGILTAGVASDDAGLARLGWAAYAITHGVEVPTSGFAAARARREALTSLR